MTYCWKPAYHKAFLCHVKTIQAYGALQAGADITRRTGRNKEAVNECTSALDAVPAYHKALVRRAKAYEQMGHYKQALSDIQKANKAETANPDTQV